MSLQNILPKRLTPRHTNSKVDSRGGWRLEFWGFTYTYLSNSKAWGEKVGKWRGEKSIKTLMGE